MTESTSEQPQLSWNFDSLDVTDPEPLPADHPLRHDARVRILPHLSWSAPGGLSRGFDLFTDNLRRPATPEPDPVFRGTPEHRPRTSARAPSCGGQPG
ncbi:hypothetical protein BBK14_17940 [Parafrankia soli]|uniref:Uncharacterized protein n=1 Tax=Parafrankia soli TaxID=2599596 RepID=A0A1S1Q4H8_9ACTN|nr:hypothetical protein [Parafrankia soli]OHV28516.1 hypothetical protein BBK14_17940 [Parafrankia soli]